MGYGDEIMATGLARGMRERGKRAAFGDGRKIVYSPWSAEMFTNNPNIASPGDEQRNDLQWVPHYKGHRLYNRLENGRWAWNYSFHAQPGEFFFTEAEQKTIAYARDSLNGFIVIEPNVPWHKSVAPNKDWGESKYQELTRRLLKQGTRVVQFVHRHTKRRLRGVTTLQLHNFREAIGMLSLARLYIGPEGGMHHAAAAVGTPAVVLMGGFIPPSVVGYRGHVNLTGGADEACGSLLACDHCRAAMQRISVDEVYEAAWATATR